jgi:cold shock CspA family protein
MSTQYQGTLKFMHPKGYGFIASDNGEDHFVHRNDLERGSQINCDLLENGVTRFRYELEQDSRNNELKAVRLSVIWGGNSVWFQQKSFPNFIERFSTATDGTGNLRKNLKRQSARHVRHAFARGCVIAERN